MQLAQEPTEPRIYTVRSQAPACPLLPSPSAQRGPLCSGLSFWLSPALPTGTSAHPASRRGSAYVSLIFSALRDSFSLGGSGVARSHRRDDAPQVSGPIILHIRPDAVPRSILHHQGI